jgi:Uma2 family endonuclease
MEVVSEWSENRERDLEVKPRDYAAAGIPEDWVIDPQEGRITVLALEGAFYRVHGVFGRGEQATSVSLPGFGAVVDDVFGVRQGK